MWGLTTLAYRCFPRQYVVIWWGNMTNSEHAQKGDCWTNSFSHIKTRYPVEPLRRRSQLSTLYLGEGQDGPDLKLRVSVIEESFTLWPLRRKKHSISLENLKPFKGTIPRNAFSVNFCDRYANSSKYRCKVTTRLFLLLLTRLRSWPWGSRVTHVRLIER